MERFRVIRTDKLDSLMASFSDKEERQSFVDAFVALCHRTVVMTWDTLPRREFECCLVAYLSLFLLENIELIHELVKNTECDYMTLEEMEELENE